MSVFKQINLPEINSASDMKKIKNYLAQMDENIKYAIENIDDENITKKFIDDLTVRHLLITNGDNSIIANPDDGFVMLKGAKKQLVLDINTGEAFFGGEINSVSGNIGGWIIEEDGLSSLNTNAAIKIYDLENLSMLLKNSGLHFFDRRAGGEPYQGGLQVTYGQDNQGGVRSGLSLFHVADAEYLSIGYTADTVPSEGAMSVGMYFTENGFNTENNYYGPGFHFLKDVSISNLSCANMNGGTPALVSDLTDLSIQLSNWVIANFEPKQGMLMSKWEVDISDLKQGG